MELSTAGNDDLPTHYIPQAISHAMATPQPPPKKLTLRELQARRARAEAAYAECMQLIMPWNDGNTEEDAFERATQAEELAEVHRKVMERIGVLRAAMTKDPKQVRRDVTGL